MEPEFGCDIWKLLFEQISPDVINNKIESTILDAVSIWMPYITIDNIIFDYDDTDIDNNKIVLDIKFSLSSNRNLSETIEININN